MDRLRVASFFVSLTALVACSGSSSSAPSESSSNLTDEAPVALRFAKMTDSGWVAVVEAADRAFQEEVSIAYPDASGTWVERKGKPLQDLGNFTGLWFVDGLPSSEPLPFAVHLRDIFSGGTVADYWDNNGGRNYSAGHDHAPMGPGVDVAVTDVAVTAAGGGSALVAKLLVRNLAYEKKVEILYTTDNWQTSSRTAGTFDHGGGADGEVWTVTANLDASVTDVAFAASAEQNGQTAWDNGFGRNFACRKAGGAWSCSGASLVACTASGCVPYPQSD